MKNSLQKLFNDELEEMYASEKLIIETLPLLIKASSAEQLQNALTKLLKESSEHITRIEKLFTILDITSSAKTCGPMKAILQAANKLIKLKKPSALLDATIIAMAQKIEHYKIASYGILRSFADHLNLSVEVIGLLQATLEEEEAADKKLTSIAVGSFFSKGINDQARATILKTPK